MTTEEKIKFYKLTELDLPLIFEMNESELKVYCWLSVHLPFDNSKAIEIDTAQLAEEIGISRRSVQRALKCLDTRKLFDVEITKAKVKRLTTSMSLGDTDVAKTPPVSRERHECRRNDMSVAGTPPVSRTTAETLVQKEPQSSKTIQTYTDFRKTLSDRERENFLNFSREKTKNFSPQINDIEGWLAKKNEAEQNRWEVYYDLFHKSQPELVQAAQNTKWERHPHHDEWLAEIERTGNPAMFANNKEKQEFVKWCWETKQFSWLKEEGNDGL